MSAPRRKPPTLSSASRAARSIDRLDGKTWVLHCRTWSSAAAGLLAALLVAAAVVEQHFVFANVKEHGRQVDKSQSSGERRRSLRSFVPA